MATYDDYEPRPVQLGPLDKTFRDTNIIVLIIFSVCCGLIALAIGLVGLLTAKDPKAKSNAMLVVIISGILSAVGIAMQFLGIMAGIAGGGAQ